MAEEHVVSAYCDTEEERAAARSVLRDAVEYEGVIEGIADAGAIAELNRRRIMVAYAEPRETPYVVEGPLATVSKRTDPDLQERLRDLKLQVESYRAAPPPMAEAAEESTYVEGGLLGVAEDAKASDTVPSPEPAVTPEAYQVKLAGAMRPQWREELAKHGLEISGYRRGAYEMLLDPQEVETVRSMPWVKEVRPYELIDRASTGLLARMQEKQQEIHEGVAVLAEAAVPEQETFDAVVHRERDLPRLREVLESSGDAEIVEQSRFAIRFRTGIESPTIARVADLPFVRTVLPYKRPELYSDRAREIVGLTKVNAVLPPKQWTGDGEIVAVLDSGIDDTHVDFDGQILQKISWRNCSTVDSVGHGTHVAGIVAGTGKKSDGKIAGIASGAKLVIVGIVDDDGRPVLPLDIGELLAVAADAGAKIINASWGRPLGSSYDSGSASVDRFVHEHPDILVVVAAGNEGKAPDGKYKFRSIGAPATAKNVLTVGACNTDRPIDRPLGVFRPSLFPKPDASNDPTAGNADLVAGISSRGPTDYDSVKPDVIAPGTYILAPRAKQFRNGLQWMGFDNNDYAYVGGTSMATPVVSGAAAVLREYLRKERNTANPSSALLKAILISSTHRIPARNDPAAVAKVGYPDFDQGFGRVDLSSIIPDGTDPARHLTFVDVPNDSPLALESRVPPGAPRKSLRTYTLTLADGAPAPLVVTLTWIDPPGNDIQNNLQLDVRGPNELFLVGNATHVFNKDPLFNAEPSGIVFDKRNNVEQIRIDAAVPGTYLVRVTAHNTVAPPQGYAIAAVGNVQGELA